MKLTIYRVLSFLLIPIAVLFSFCVLILISAAIGNPAVLLPLFMIACVAVYSFASLSFLIKGIDGRKYLGKSRKDWLRVNAIVSCVFAVLMISQCIIIISHPNLFSEIVAQAQQNSINQLKLNEDQLIRYLRGCCYFFLVYGIVLFVHLLLSFQLMRSYNFLFYKEENQP